MPTPARAIADQLEAMAGGVLLSADAVANVWAVLVDVLRDRAVDEPDDAELDEPAFPGRPTGLQ